MQAPNKKRYYIPQFSQLTAVSLCRLAWTIGMLMPATVDLMVQLISSLVDPTKICLACKDNTRYLACGFFNPPAPHQRA